MSIIGKINVTVGMLSVTLLRLKFSWIKLINIFFHNHISNSRWIDSQNTFIGRHDETLRLVDRFDICATRTYIPHSYVALVRRPQQLALMLRLGMDANMCIDHEREHAISYERTCSPKTNMSSNTNTNTSIEYEHACWARKNMRVPPTTRQYQSKSFIILVLESVMKI